MMVHSTLLKIVFLITVLIFTAYVVIYR